MNIVQKFEQQQVAKLVENKKIPEFRVGDTVTVNVKIVEGNNERVQAFEGVCIAKKNRGVHSSFIVRKISHGEGVERIFPLYSPRIDSIKLVRRGDVRRAKLYYMRDLTGKAARIAEKKDVVKAEATAAPAAKAEATEAAPAPKKKAAKA